jgi:hypothetical protein
MPEKEVPQMRHKREEVIQRTIIEFEKLDELLAHLGDADWERPLLRPETKDPWTVKDAVAHITHWKADTARRVRGQRRPVEERGLDTNEDNHLIYIRWRNRSPQEVLSWHRLVHKDMIAALREAPDEYFSAKERSEQWPYDLDGHSLFHRVHDIERALTAGEKKH